MRLIQMRKVIECWQKVDATHREAIKKGLRLGTSITIHTSEPVPT